MNLYKEILHEHSKAQANKIVAWVGNSQQRFDELVKLFLGDEYRVTQRAGWPLSNLAIEHPQLVKKHLPAFVKLLTNDKKHNAVKRNIVRLLQVAEIPEKLHGDVMDICFRFVADVKEAAAVKAFSLTILENLSQQYPEILNELKVIIEERWNYETPAFHSRAKKILVKSLQKKKNSA
jgi:hypothetical protein